MPITPFDNSVAFSQIEDAYSALLQHPTPSGGRSVEALSESRSKEEGGVVALDGKRHPRIASMGGDHSIVLPILRSLHKVYGPITVIHMDAHLDSWQPKAYGSSVWESAQAGYSHGTMFHHAAVEGLTANNSVHLGLRGLLSGDDYDDYVHDASCGFSYLETQEMVDMGLVEVARLVKERVGNSPVYLSIDVDVMDPSVAPGTGTPVAGGLLSREVRELIRLLKGINLVGVDVVEVSPPYDSQAEITALAAAELMYELITIMVLHPLDRVAMRGLARPSRRWEAAEAQVADMSDKTAAGDSLQETTLGRNRGSAAQRTFDAVECLMAADGRQACL
jgi:agmatinase